MGISSQFSILLVDGTTISPETLKSGLESGQEFFGYGIDSYGDIVITQITSVEKSGDKREMSRLFLLGTDLLEKITDDQQIVKMVKKAPSPTPLSCLGKGDALYTLIRYKDNEDEETRKVLKDYVFTITTETGNFAIEPGLFLKS